MPNVKHPQRQLRKTFLREWRKYRGFTQEEASEYLDTERSNLSRIERAQVPYSQELLEAAAVAYKCEPWDILNVNPLKQGDAVDLMSLISRKDSDLARRVLEQLPNKPTETNDN